MTPKQWQVMGLVSGVWFAVWASRVAAGHYGGLNDSSGDL